VIGPPSPLVDVSPTFPASRECPWLAEKSNDELPRDIARRASDGGRRKPALGIIALIAFLTLVEAPAGSAWNAHLMNSELRRSFTIGFLILLVFIGTFTYAVPPLALSPMALGLSISCSCRRR